MEKKRSDYSCGKWWEFLKKTDGELLAYCRIDCFKGSGRGGQKRNKTSNAIRLSIAYLSATASESRSKMTNQQNALKRLRYAIALDICDMSERKLNQTQMEIDCLPYTQNHLIRINPKNPSYLLFIAHLVDMTLQFDGDTARMAEAVNVSSSQLNRFIQKDGHLKEKIKQVRDSLKRGDGVEL